MKKTGRPKTRPETTMIAARLDLDLVAAVDRVRDQLGERRPSRSVVLEWGMRAWIDAQREAAA